MSTSILKVDSPSCIWSRVSSGPGGEADTVEQYRRLALQMNLFYHDVSQQEELKPSVLEQGQVCVVYWSVLRSWCRATVESLFVDSVCCTASCLLVDHGERLLVSSDQIRVARQEFLQLPFWVKKCHLAGIKPTTLKVNLVEDNAKLTPSTQWDSSATLYLHNLLRVSRQSEVVLLEGGAGSTPIMLYVTVENIKICVNDDLVAKKFGVYHSQLAAGRELDELEQEPVMLPASVLKQTAGARTPPPASSPAPLTPPSTPQRPRHQPTFWEEGGVCAASRPVLRPHAAVAARPQSFQQAPSVGAGRTWASPGGWEEEDSSQEEQHQAPPGVGAAERPAAPCTPQAELQQKCVVSSSGASEGWEAEEKTCREDLLCARLMEWLNPGPLNRDPDAPEDTQVGPSGPSKSTVLVHSALPVEPCSSWDDAPLLEHLRRGWWRTRYGALSPADCYSWPSVSRGCHTLVVSPRAEQPLSYLPPLLTNILLSSDSTCHTSSSGPVAVLLCPGWEKAQVVFELLEELKVTRSLHPRVVLLGLGEDEAQAFRMPKNCLVLVTTPFTLVRLLSCHCFLFLRLSHLVLDGADQLFTLAPEQMTTILQHFQKVTTREEARCRAQQLLAVAKRWTGHMASLLANHMPCACIVVSVLKEVALYAGVQQMVLLAVESRKSWELLPVLDVDAEVGQKTVVITRSAQEVEEVFKALGSVSAFCLMVHETSSHHVDYVMQQWRKAIGPRTHVVLVTTAPCLRSLDVRDATRVIHYDFPASPSVFGQRLFCMADNFRDLSQQAPLQAPLQSVLLVSERNTAHSVGIVRFLERAGAQLPPPLLSFAQGVLAAREEQKMERPLCSYLKTSGVCRDSSVCPDRHRLMDHLDQPLLPASAAVQVLPLYVKTASVFYGRVIGQEHERELQSMQAELAALYAERRPAAVRVEEGGLYVVQEDTAFHRVKVLSVAHGGHQLFFSALVLYMDVGKTEEVKSYQILELPQQFHGVPGQAVEMVVCRVRPADGEKDWHPKATRAIRQKVQGVQHQARAVLSLGKTLFLDPMVCVSRVPGTRTVIHEYNVRSEILHTGMAVDNPDHLELLRALGQGAAASSGSGEGPASLETTNHAEGCPRPQRLGPVSPAAQTAGGALAPGCEEALLTQRNREDGGLSSPTGQLAAPPLGHNGEEQLSAGGAHQELASSFHPQVCWYQTRDSVVVTVKLLNPEEQSCHFYPDRVVYRSRCWLFGLATSVVRRSIPSLLLVLKTTSDLFLKYFGRANGRRYRADLELQASIDAESCSWEMRCNQPVLKLVKQQQGYWERFLRNKNIFVSYNMEHCDSEEDGAPNGGWFVEDTGEEHWYVDSDSSSESD